MLMIQCHLVVMSIPVFEVCAWFLLNGLAVVRCELWFSLAATIPSHLFNLSARCMLSMPVARCGCVYRVCVL